MGRDYYINGEAMVYVKGNSSTAISSLTELGLAMDSIKIKPSFRHEPIRVNNWWNSENELQFQMTHVEISVALSHFDPAVVRECVKESMGGTSAFGTLARAGARLGNGLPRFQVAGGKANHFVSVNITSPVAGVPWRFYHCYLTDPPYEYQLGVERSYVNMNWRCIPYCPDPWNGGAGMLGVVLFDHGSDA